MDATATRAVRLALLALLAVVGIIVSAPPASAATGDLTFDACLGQDTTGGFCSDIPGSAFNLPRSVVVSPDGDSVYVSAVGSNSDSVTHFFVGPGGQLTFGGCVSDDGSGGACANVPGAFFQDPNSIVVSPDGDSVYVASEFSNSVSHFFAAPGGQLTFGGCASNSGAAGMCLDVPGTATFLRPGGLAMSPDGDSLYVASTDSDVVSHFFAAPGGQITFGGCVSQDGSGGLCADVPGAAFDGPESLEVSPNGASLYVASTFSNSVSHFFAAPAGQITFGGCVSQDGSGGSCADVPGAAFNLPIDLEVSPNGGSLYVASDFSSSVSHFFAAPGGQITFGGCVSQDGSGGSCADVPGSSLIRVADLATSPDGNSLYVVSTLASSLNQFRVAPQGQLTFASCASNDGTGGQCLDVPGSAPFQSPLAAAVSPDGRSVYADGASASTINRFAREPAPAADTTPPGLTLTVGKKPQAGKPVEVTVTCTEACAIDLTASAKPKGSKRGNLKPASTNLGAGASATLKLKPKGKLKKALRSSGKGKATIDATATDAAGNAADATAKVKLK